MMKIFAFVLGVAFVSAAPQADDNDDLELSFGTVDCEIDSPDRDECLKEAIQDMLPKLANGIESLQIPALDPYIINNRSITFNRGPFTVALTVRMAYYGVSKAKILNLKTKFTKTNFKFFLEVYVPRTFLEGSYRGKINNFKMKSDGHFNVTTTDINVICRVNGDFITIHGEEYAKVTRFDVSPQVGDIKVLGTGLLPDPQATRVALEFANQYLPFFIRETFLPRYRKTIEPLLIEEANNFLSQAPINRTLDYDAETD